jgi:hypothetical protein
LGSLLKSIWPFSTTAGENGRCSIFPIVKVLLTVSLFAMDDEEEEELSAFFR